MKTNTPLPQATRPSEPSHQEITALVTLFNEGRYPEAASLAQALTERFPLHGFGWKALGALLKQMGRTSDALLPMQNAAALSPNDLESHHNLGNALRELGRLEEAEASCRRALQINPGYAEAHCNLGAIQQKLSRPGEAEASFRRALQIDPHHAEAHYNLGNTLRELGRPDEAEASYRQALQTKPHFANAHCNLSITLDKLGRPDEAEASCRQALQIDPDYADAHCHLGNILQERGRPDEAEASYRRALQLKPDFVEAHCNLGNALQDLGQCDDAAACYRRALQIKPDYAEAHCNLGNTLHELELLDEAEASCRRALQLKPDFAEAHCNLGNTLHELGRLGEAEASCRRALQLKPDFAEAHYNLGNTLRELDRMDEAEASYRRALQIKPNFAGAHCNRGIALGELGRLDDAMTSYRLALEIKPDFAMAHCNLGNALQDLGRLDEAVASHCRALEIKPDFSEAHSNLLFTHNYLADQPAATLQAEARRFGDLVARKASPYEAWRNAPEPGRRLRVGLVSGDFRMHPVGYFIESVLAALAFHASGRLELIAYPSYFRSDALTERIKACCSAWHSAVGLSDAQLAQLIRDDSIDILIDLSGHTAHNRLPMFAWKPAPVQTSWLGYFATTGVAAMDYLIADPWTLPEAEEAHFTETIWRLPETRLCFTPPDAEGAVSPLPALTNTNGRITFGCFNNLSKMNDAVVALWARILNAAPQSRLFLKAKQLGEASVRQSVLERFAAQGIAAGRLMLEGPSPRREYLATYDRVDIALDPFPYTGGATTAEALWMGVPVLTLAGERFLARQGVGLLTNAGLPEWIAADADDYVARAVLHAGDLPRLAALRQGLRQQVLASPIFDAPRFARHFEEALRGMWTTWCDRCDQQQNQQQQTEAWENTLEEPAANEPGPEDINTLVTLFNEGRYPEAATLAQALTERFPLNGFCWKALGALLKQMGRTSDALLPMQKAAALSPNDPESHHNLGNALRELGRLGEAEASCRRALQINPGYAEAHCNLGAIQQKLFLPDEAEASFRRALLAEPHHAEAHYNLGNTLRELGRPDEAEASYRQALQTKPHFAEAHCNRGIALGELGRFDDAAASTRRALEIKPDYAEAHSNLGNALQDLGRLDDAAASYRRALEIKPDYAEAHSNLLFAHNYLSDQPAATLLAEARRFGELVAQKASPTQTWLNVPEPGRCLRVGLVSGDLRDHVVGYFIENMLASLASNAAGRLELIAYSNDSRADALTERIKACCHGWHLAVGLSDAQLAQLIRDDGIDILIDLSGHTAHNRLPMFAWKPAPVQASWLGYFATTGVAAMDYFIADPWTLPETEEVNFNETIWCLPETYLCFTPPDMDIEVSPLPALENGRITFGCFNNLSKMNDAVVALWATVLHAAPESRLFLKAKQLGEASVRQSVLERFASHGIGADRLILEGAAPRAELLAAYRRVDIALDPFPYPGGTTSIEALWMGVPVLTLMGDRFLSHIGESILQNAGLPEWIAADARDYVARAVSHAGDLQRMAALRKGLRQQVLASPIFDAPRFARHFETALRGMWAKWCDRCDRQQRQQQRTEGAEAWENTLEEPAANEPGPEDINTLVILFNEGRTPEAATLAQALTERFPLRGFGWKALGALLKQMGRTNDALLPMQKAAALSPNDAASHYNLGSTLDELGRLEEAETSYRRTLQIAPDFAEAHYHLGNALQKLGRPDEAETSYRQALQIAPDHAHAHYNLGNILHELGRPGEAETSYRRALQIKPNYAEAHCNLGNILHELGRLDEAEASCRRALQINPDFAETHNNLGRVLQDRGRLVDAMASYRQALEIKPNFAEPHNNLGNVLNEFGRLDDALASYRQALEIKSDFTEAHSNLLFSHNYLADQPAAMLLAEARRFGDLAAQKANPTQTWLNVPEPGKCLRVGLVSGDLGEHPVGYFLDSILAALMSTAAGRLELIAYSTHIHADALTERIKACCRAWHSAAGLSDEKLAQRIRDDGIDILIDLSGHTSHNRLPIFAWKPAPVQASWLGYFATTGVAAMDYLIADPWTLPETEEVNFTETIWRLPETRLCFTPPDAEGAVSPLPALTNGRLTFGCFNSLNKMNDAVVALWASVLHAISQSRLFLKAKQLGEASVRQSVLERFAAHGIGAGRLILEGPSPRLDYLAAYRRVDIALDPFPYTGGATTAEALWMGVPVLTLAGERFLARQGVGLLANAGLPEWIATDADDYVARVVSHASDLPRLAALRTGLRQQVLASPLCDAPRFARHFEAALRGMWTKWCDRQQRQPQRRQQHAEAAAPRISPDNPAPAEPLTAAEMNRLAALSHAGRHAEMESSARSLITQHPDSGFAWKALGIALAMQGKAALPAWQKATALLPDDAMAHYNLGVILQGVGQLDGAAASYRRTVEINADFADAHCNLGNVLKDLGRLDDAVASYRRAVDINPDFAEAHCNLGNALQSLEQPDDAAAACRRALLINPDFAEAHCNLGNALQSLGQLDDAAVACRRALLINPDFAEAHFNLGVILHELDRLDEAETSYRQALQINPDYAEAHCNLGLVCHELGRLDEAEAGYRQALQIKPDFATMHQNLAATLLAQGKLTDGWEENEWRWETAQLSHARRHFAQPQWRGEAAEGKTLLIHAEQGYGDTLQFCRYAQLATARGLRVILEAPPALTRLLQSLPGADLTIAAGAELPPFDLHCPMLSMPLALKTTLATIPAAVPYLHADPAQADAWRARLDALPHRGFRIGLVWAGNPRTHSPSLAAVDRRRSVAPELLAPLFDLPGLHFFSLQKGGAQAPANFPLTDFMEEMEDFADTAALIANLDLVISVDTAVAHLAAALGKPVWLLDRYDSCWRWLRERRDSPWYPTLRLFRQPGPGDWQAVIEKAVEELTYLQNNRAPAEPPTAADAHYNLGIAQHELGHLDNAAASYRRALAIKPDFAEAHNNLGVALKDFGHLDDAAASTRRALEIKPDFAEAHNNLGVVLQGLGQLDDAAASFRQALALKPDFALAHSNLGNVWRNLGRLDDAAASCRRALAIDPDFAEAHGNLGGALQGLGQLDDAVASCRQALRIKPDDANAHHNLALMLLKQGELTAGWEEYEWRWATSQMAKAHRHFAQPQWRGEAAEGKTLLIHAEQGYGDTLQFCRYAQLAAARGLRVIVEAPPALARLLQSLPGANMVIAFGAELPSFDLHCPMLSMPLALNTTLATIPSSASYLHADPAQVDAWRARLDALPHRGFRIGLVWAGNPRVHSPHLAVVDQRRSVAPELLAPLFDLPGLHFFSLQKDGAAAPAHFPLTDFMDEMEDFADTAALIANLDLVISVDTAVAHLAAALGKPVWVLDRFDSCWRWLRERRDSPWYPTLRLFRQPKPGDWQAAIEQAVEELASLINIPAPTGLPADSLEPSFEPPSAQAPHQKTGDAEAHSNQNALLKGKGQTDHALKNCRRESALDPGSAVKHYNLGVMLHHAEQYADAAASYRRALESAPHFAEAHNNLGVCLRYLGRLDDALDSCRRALNINPHFALAHNNLGLFYKDTGRLDDAVASYRRAVETDPHYTQAHSNLVYMLYFHPDFDERSILAEAKQFAAALGQQRLPATGSGAMPHFAAGNMPVRRLRIGYVSPDFRDHCQSFFTLPLLSNHDHSQFDIYCYADLARPDAMSERLAACADAWRNTHLQNDAQLAETIAVDGIDILVDLTMHMSAGRPGLFAQKPAPVQIAWLAYPGTTGLSTIDFRLTDPWLDPVELGDERYSEASIRLPDTFWCYDPLVSAGDDLQPNPLPALTAGYVTFGCLNNFCKVTDDTLCRWGHIMARTPSSRLILLTPAGLHRRRITDLLGRFDIDSERIAFVDYQARTAYLQTYHRIDLCLDTLPYNGHTTSLDATWMGVPVVTQVGNTVVGRAGWSQLNNLGHAELAAFDDQAFIDIAVALAADLPRLSRMRSTLRSDLEASPLMNGKRFALAMESAYREAYKNIYCSHIIGEADNETGNE